MGNGVLDSPDGGRSHRPVLINELIKQGADILMLQQNRDLIEAGDNMAREHLLFTDSLPEIDALFVEYRWKIPGRNCEISKQDCLYTPDLDRQNELLAYYQAKDIPILIWDKDQKLDDDLSGDNITIFEAALKPKKGRKRLLFPMDQQKMLLARQRLDQYSRQDRDYKLVYVGNQYERDTSFKKYIDHSASLMDYPVPVFGNWDKYPAKYQENLKSFPHVDFQGRVSFDKIASIYDRSLVTCLIAPERYYHSGQYTQRLFECVWGLCISLVPSDYYAADQIIIKDWIVQDGRDVVKKIKAIENSSDSLIKEQYIRQFQLLNVFSVEQQAAIIINEIKGFHHLSRYASRNRNIVYKPDVKGNYLVKRYDSSERFNCELEYLQQFKEQGFIVPAIFSVDESARTICLENLSGRSYSILDETRIWQCLSVLAEIVRKFDLNQEKEALCQQYINKVSENILSYAQANGFSVNQASLTTHLAELKNNFYPGLFKDAKPTNWIFSQDNLYLIDFDYVRKSFFLADLAQLLTHLMVYRRIEIGCYLDYFLSLTSLGSKTVFYNLLLVAMINSNILSLKYNPNLDDKTAAAFKRQIKSALSELAILSSCQN